MSYIYRLTWPASPDILSVSVTGNFDGWSRSEIGRLHKNGLSEMYETIVKVKQKQKLVFKFIVNDVNWEISDSLKNEFDEHGNRNNYVEANELEEVRDVLSDASAGATDHIGVPDLAQQSSHAADSLSGANGFHDPNESDTSQSQSDTSQSPSEGSTSDHAHSESFPVPVPSSSDAADTNENKSAGFHDQVGITPSKKMVIAEGQPEDSWHEADSATGDDKENLVYLSPAESSFTELSFVTSDSKLHSPPFSVSQESFSGGSESAADLGVTVAGVTGQIEGSDGANDRLGELNRSRASSGIFGRLQSFFRG